MIYELPETLATEDLGRLGKLTSVVPDLGAPRCADGESLFCQNNNVTQPQQQRDGGDVAVPQQQSIVVSTDDVFVEEQGWDQREKEEHSNETISLFHYPAS